ncbi:metal ABC transporter permease, partial [Campylobacter coli]
MILASVLSMIFCVLGLIISYYFNLSSGACIIAVACFGFLIHLTAPRLNFFHTICLFLLVEFLI